MTTELGKDFERLVDRCNERNASFVISRDSGWRKDLATGKETVRPPTFRTEVAKHSFEGPDGQEARYVSAFDAVDAGHRILDRLEDD